MNIADNPISYLRPNKQRLSGILVATAYVSGIAFIRVFPMYTPISGPHVQIALTVLLAIGMLFIARFSRYPLIPILAVPLLALAGMDGFLACANAGCRIPSDYEPWRNLKIFFGQGFLGPRLMLSSRPSSCVILCPYSVEILPLTFAYILIWIGSSKPEPW